MICISDRIPLISDQEINEIDPLGCISYKIFVKNKNAFKPCNLNRNLNNVTVISTDLNEFNSDFNENLLIISKFNGQSDSNLMDLVHFFTNLHFMNVSNVRTVISSYSGYDFFSTFKRTQERLFNQRNLFGFDNFKAKLDEINLKKIWEYQGVKMKLAKPFDYSGYKDYALRFLRSAFL